MENPCKIVFFGDSIIGEATLKIEQTLRIKYADRDIAVINAGVAGETSRDGLKRIGQLVNESQQVVVVGFGMNDWRTGLGKEEFKRNMLKIVTDFEATGTRVILSTISPGYVKSLVKESRIIDAYNRVIKNIAQEKRIKIADVNSLWKKEIKPIQKGLRDKIHPNEIGYNIYHKVLMRVVTRRNTTICWQYNGREAICNYKCPYCYYLEVPKQTDHFSGTISAWHAAFKRSFRYQHLMFYLGFGEPMIGKDFYDVVDMIGAEPNWELRIISNLSISLDKIVNSQIVKEKRLYIQGTFHPLSTHVENFLKQLLFLRKHGIETPVLYVAYPPHLKRFEADFKIFNKHNFLVHIRRFVGGYKGKRYPDAYTDEERQFIAHYSDDASIKYMLNMQQTHRALTYLGMYFFVIDNNGNVGLDSDMLASHKKHRSLLGNILQDSFSPSLEPILYQGDLEGTTDSIVNLLKLDYKELEGNHILSFAKQSGVYHTDNGVFYKNMETDFNDSKIRAEYNFPARNLKDEAYRLFNNGLKNYLGDKFNSLVALIGKKAAS